MASKRRRWPGQRRRGPLPKGAGKVHCLECDVYAAADGRGTPIVLKHLAWCSEHPDNLAKRGVI